jgi:hypothetical protein
MSFDLFLQCFRNGAPETFPTALIEDGFGSYASVREPRCWVLRYPNGGFGELYVDAAREDISHFMVARPPDSPEFWRTLFDLLQQTPSCLYWPGGGPVIANPAVRNHLPSDMIESLGEPIVVSKPEQIIEAIRNS